jgi:hypothetical protein
MERACGMGASSWYDGDHSLPRAKRDTILPIQTR